MGHARTPYAFPASASLRAPRSGFAPKPDKRPAILVFGAESLVGKEVLQNLAARGLPAQAARSGPAPRALQAFLSAPAYFDVEAVDPRCLDELREAGVRKIVFLSSFEAGVGASRTGESYRRLEERIIASRFPYTILRAAPLMQELTTFDLPYPVRNHHLLIPYGEARSAFVDARDVATVAVRALTESGHEMRVYSLTGPEALSLHDLTASISRVTGVDYHYRHTDVGTFKLWAREAGYTDSLIDSAAEYYSICRKGTSAQIFHRDDLLAGRSLISFPHFVRDYAKSLSTMCQMRRRTRS
jgi:uncharacterized protein YbjT (DUF2867 family)